MNLNGRGIFSPSTTTDISGDKEKKRTLQNFKNSLQMVIQDDSLSTIKKNENLGKLLKEVANVLKQGSLSNDCTIATLILMVELYGHLSLTQESSYHKGSDVFIEEAYNLAALCDTKIQHAKSLNVAFIQSCNTFNIHTASEVYKLVDTFFSKLTEQAKEQPFFEFETPYPEPPTHTP